MLRPTVPADLAEERRDVFVRMVEAARTPGGRLVVLGEPGLGKSHLVDALVRALPPDLTLLFLRARGEATEPLAGLAELLAPVPDAGLPEGEADALRREVADRRTDPAPPRAGQDHELADAVTRVLAHLARGAVTLVVDEWQWLDRETLALLEDVLTRPGVRERVAVVAAGRRPRTGDPSRADFFAPDQVVRLGPLRPTSIVRVLDAAGLTGLPVSTLAAIAEDSGGNPLWAMALATARVTGDPRAAARSAADGPQSRLDALTTAVGQLLATVELSGGPPDEAMAHALVEAAEVALVAGDAGAGAELLRPLDVAALTLPELDRVAWLLAESTGRTGGERAVALLFDALQRSLSPGSGAWQVAEVHRLVATPAGPPEVLPAAVSAEETPRTLARALSGRARRRLDRGLGVDDALLARVRELEPVPGLVGNDAGALSARWAYQVDDLARSRAELAVQVRVARRAGEPYAVVDGLAHAATVEVLSGRLGPAETLLAQADEPSSALSTLPSSVHRARGVLALARDDRSELDRLLTGPLGPEAPDESALLRAAVTGLDDAASGAWAEAAVELGRARAASEAGGMSEPGRRLWVDVDLVRALVQLGRLAEASEIVDALTELGSRPGRVHARGQARRLRALVAWGSGDLPTALRLSDRATGDLEAGGHRPQLVAAQLERVGMLQDDGQVVQARGLLTTATDLATTIDDPRLLGAAERTASELATYAGRAALTPAELRVARAVAGGQSNRDIAADLFVSVRTVETHVASAYRKLGVRTRTQLALSLNDLPLGSGSAVSRRSS